MIQFLKEMAECPLTTASSRRAPRHSVDERDPLMQREYGDTETDGTSQPLNGGETKPLAGGTILGIHNLAIVMPQFIVSIILDFLSRTLTGSRTPQIAVVASLIFRIVDESAPIEPPPSHPEGVLLSLTSGGLGDHTTYFGKNGVAWVLRFGGLCTLLGAAFARMVPLTKAEKEIGAAFKALKALKAEEEEP